MSIPNVYIHLQGPNEISSALVSQHTTSATSETQYYLVELEQDQQDLYDAIVEYCILNPVAAAKLYKSEDDHINSLPIKKRKKYKKRRWKGHSYGVHLVLHTAYLIQGYHFAFGVEGKPINPSKCTLAKEIGICVRTLDKALKILRSMGVVSWESGKKTWETNTYYLADCYKTTPMRKPEGFKHPRALWLKMQYIIKIQKLKDFTRTLYEHLLTDIADHLLRREKFIRSSLDKKSNFLLKPSKDPPKKRKKPANWHILRSLRLSFKDQYILGRYSESILRAAVDDMTTYLDWGKTIYNKAAFLMSRCKLHKEAAVDNNKLEEPKDIKSWLMSYFKKNKSKFQFISTDSELDLATSEAKPFINLKFHKDDLKKSVLKVFQKVQGSWIDKVFSFDRPDLAESIENYLENSIKMA